MAKFADLLHSGIHQQRESVSIWVPPTVFGKLAQSTNSGLGKWLGYIDKWLISLPLLFVLSTFKRNTYFHIADHSNSPYISVLPKNRTSITCHDVLAIRGALGYEDAHCQASRAGRILQQWILKNLLRAKKLATVSELTMQQLKELGESADAESDWRVIHNAFNANFYPMDLTRSNELLQRSGIKTDQKFILHIGSNLPRKNRKMLLEMVAKLGNTWEGEICFAGQPMDESLRQRAAEFGIASDRILEVPSPDHETLVALYTRCHAMIFPSYSEGFGWPVIEAQACGAPVIASDVQPMPEVSGGAALHVAPDDADGFAEALSQLDCEEKRAELREAGLQNTQRFGVGKMIDAYINLIDGK